ncbi:MAG: major facilitator superfamily transporter, partial [Acidobacteria bacterium]|nr:major facilitator superfamily transporter [Acidobacteriota bacterium]
PIVPDIIDDFHLTLTAAALLPFSFFLAYGVMSIPTGMLVEAYGEKRVILAAFLLAFLGSVTFALTPHYGMAICSLFVIGVGMAALQVAINPLLRVTGGEEHFAFNSATAQLIFGVASFLSPRIYSYLVSSMGGDPGLRNPLISSLSRLVPAGMPWVSIYWIFAAVTFAMVVIIFVSRFPAVERTTDEQAGTWDSHRKLLSKPIVYLYFFSVFTYVGCEQGTSNWISEFLSRYHHYDPHTAGADAVSWFWGLLTAGCFLGMLLLKVFDSRKVLIAFSCAALVCLTAALFGSAPVSRIAFPLMGLAASVMWPIIISLALNSVEELHGSFSGILCTAIVGGAVVPLIIGRLGDWFGLRTGMTFLYLTFGWVLSVGFWARPIIKNKTIS